MDENALMWIEIQGGPKSWMQTEVLECGPKPLSGHKGPVGGHKGPEVGCKV